MCFSNFVRRNPPPISPLELSPRAKSYFRWFSTYQLFQKSSDYKTIFSIFLRVFGFFELLSPEIYQNHLFHFKPSGIHFTETLSDKYPMSRPIQGAYFLGFPTLENLAGRRRRKDAQIWPAPVPTCAGIKYPVRGNPSLWHISEPLNPTIQHKCIFLNFIWILEAREHVEKLPGSGTLHSDKVWPRFEPWRPHSCQILSRMQDLSLIQDWSLEMQDLSLI